MPPSTVGLLAAALLVLAAGAAGLALLRRIKVRYRELFEAVQSVQRRIDELAAGLDQARATLARVEERLAVRVEPELLRLGRRLELEAVAGEVRRAEDAGRLAPAVAARLGEHLAALGAEIAAGERPY
jgi:hypothetical protein